MVCFVIFVEVVSFFEENVEDFILFLEKEGDLMYMEDFFNMF